MWVDSWNNLYGETEYGLKISDNVEEQYAPGYVIGQKSWTLTNGSFYVNLSEASGYNNTLFYPHKEIFENCNGYWIASCSANSMHGVMTARYDGWVIMEDNRSGMIGIRPIVFIPSNIQFKLVDGVYEVVD